MNEVVQLKGILDEAEKERLEDNVIKLSSIVPVNKGKTIYKDPATRIILSDDERLVHVDAAYEYLQKKSMRPKNMVTGAVLVMVGFMFGFFGYYLLNLYFGNIF